MADSSSLVSRCVQATVFGAIAGAAGGSVALYLGTPEMYWMFPVPNSLDIYPQEDSGWSALRHALVLGLPVGAAVGAITGLILAGVHLWWQRHTTASEPEEPQSS